MSTPALHPTARVRPVALELLERWRGTHYVVALVMGAIAVSLRTKSVSIPYEYVVIGLMVACLLLPSLQGIDGRGKPVWDAAMPMDRARYALAGLACGTVWALFLLAVAIGLHVVLLWDAGTHSGWYPLVVFSWGLTCYLLASAALLRLVDERVHAASLVVLFLAVMRLLPASGVDPVEVGGTGAPEALAVTALPLGLACAAVYAAVRFPARSPRPSGLGVRHADAPPRVSVPALPPEPSEPGTGRADAPPRVLALPEPPAPRPARRSGPARPAATLTVFRRHFELQRGWALPALTVLVFGMAMATLAEEEGETVREFVEATGLRQWCMWIALSWTVLVWVNERGPQRRWNDALPVDTAKRRVLHAAAGAAWLLRFAPVGVAVPLGIAAAAGTLPTDAAAWLWLELTCRTLTLYLAATFVLFGMRVVYAAFPLLWLIVLGLPYVFRTIIASQLPGNVDPGGWSFAAAALWLVLYAAAAAGAVALSDWADRNERLPTTEEVRRWLRAFARPAAAGRTT